MIFDFELSGKRREIGLQRLNATTIDFCERSIAADECDGGPSLSACFGQHEGAVLKIERCETQATGKFCAGFQPSKSPSDHQVNDNPQIVVETNRDAFSNSSNVADSLALDFIDRRLNRPNDKRVADAKLVERAASYVRRDCLDVDRDIGQFRHD